LPPAYLLGTVVLSYFATLGACQLVFEHIFGFKGADVSFPLFAFIFLVALGIDYNIFLMTRVREESAKIGTRAGVIKGLTVTGGVITSAGIVLAATFGVLGVLPLVFLAQLGFAVAFGVLLRHDDCSNNIGSSNGPRYWRKSMVAFQIAEQVTISNGT
jgi:putative drug exporter of the RND superfamily